MLLVALGSIGLNGPALAGRAIEGRAALFPMLDFVHQLENPRSALDGLIELEENLRRIADIQALR